MPHRMPDRSDSRPQSTLWDVYQTAYRNAKSTDHKKQAARLKEYERSVQQDSRNADAYIKLAECHKELGQYSEALSVFRDAVAQCPPTPALYQAYIAILRSCNRVEEARNVAAQCLRLLDSAEDPGVIRAVRHLALPVLYQTPEEVDEWRRRFQAGLTAFCEETTLDIPAGRWSALQAVKSWVNFELTYQGRNDRDLLHQYGQLLNRVMAANYPQWAGPVEMPAVGRHEKLRIGYAASHFYHHSVMKSHLGWLREHDKEKIDVYTYHVGRKVDATTEEVERSSVRYAHFPGDLEGACQAIVRDRLHVLVFLDIGMDPIMGLMGALRLAPVQCATWGHPMTSGLDTIDYFLSSSLMEPENAEEHYTERLVRLPGIGISYRQPVIPRAILWKRRSDFGLRGDAVLYLSCQSLRKYLPEDDHVFAEIAGRVPSAQFAFVARNGLVAADFRRRLERAFSMKGLRAEQYYVMVPGMHRVDYWNLNVLCDVYLDTMTWSGCNSTFEAVACGLPVVTMPGESLRGRHSYAILTQLGVTETIVHDKAAYVDLAVRLGVDVEWRKSIVGRMRERFPRLYGDRTSVPALEVFYDCVVAERQRAEDGTFHRGSETSTEPG